MRQMKNDLIVEILVGVPASGKSTWAKDYVKNNPGWARFNRDEIRFMTKNMPICDPKMESFINEIQEFTILGLLRKGKNVIVDNKNLKPEYIEAICEIVKYDATVRFRVFDISLEKAKERDAQREKKVGDAVIERMYKDYKKLIDSFDMSMRCPVKRIYKNPEVDKSLPIAVISDLDGTLCHMNGKRGPFDWHNVHRDDLDESVASLLRRHHDKGDIVIIVSGRDGSCRKITEDWLALHDLPYDELYMRPANDFRKDNLIKREIYDNHIRDRFNVLAVYDDRDQVVKMWRGLGLKVLQVAEGNF